MYERDTLQTEATPEALEARSTVSIFEFSALESPGVSGAELSLRSTVAILESICASLERPAPPTSLTVVH